MLLSFVMDMVLLLKYKRLLISMRRGGILTKVIFVRHGETSWNLDKRYQGHSDIALNEKGVQQAQAVAERLATERISAVYSSDLIRAAKTAELIAAQHSLPIVTIPELREVNFGLWEGLTYEQIMATWPEELSAIYSKPGAMCIPDGESFDDVSKRVEVGLARCIEKHQNETIVIVSHGGTMRVALCNALGIPIEKMWSLRQDSTAINVIEYFEEMTVVSLVNDTCHIK